jgi:periplasmic protein TonB
MANNNNSPFITTGERVRSFIGWAFVISILVHFFVMPLFPRLNQHHEQQEVEKVSVTKKIVVKVPTPPPPTPTPPPPTPPPKSTPPPKQQAPQPKPLKVNVPKTTSNNTSSTSNESKYVAPKSGSEEGVPGGTGTAAPGPVSTLPPGTPKPACKTPYQDATVVQQAQPEYPDSAREQGLGEVQVAVKVTIGPSGSLENATISQSAGNMALDQAALAAARQSTYAPKIVNCEPVTGDYLFRVTFDPNS